MFLRHTRIQIQDPRVLGPATYPLDQPAAAREGVLPISGYYVPGWATPGRSHALPLCSDVSRARISGRAPLYSSEVGTSSGAGRRGAVVVPVRDLYVVSQACFSCPGSSWSLPLLLASYGELIAPRMSSGEVLRAENDSFFCPLDDDHYRPLSTPFFTGLTSFSLIFGSPATSYRRDGLRVPSRC